METYQIFLNEVSETIYHDWQYGIIGCGSKDHKDQFFLRSYETLARSNNTLDFMLKVNFNDIPSQESVGLSDYMLILDLCPVGCTVCSQAAGCTACAPEYILSGGTCVCTTAGGGANCQTCTLTKCNQC